MCFLFCFFPRGIALLYLYRSDRPENSSRHCFFAKCLLFLSAIRVKHDNNHCSILIFNIIKIKKGNKIVSLFLNSKVSQTVAVYKRLFFNAGLIEILNLRGKI